MLLNNFGFILWHEQKKTPTTITKCIPNIPSWPTLNLSKSCIFAFEPTGPIFVRQIFVRILRACRMKVGLVGWLVGWGWRVFFFGVSLKGRANLVLPKGWWDFCLADLRDQFKEDMFCSVPTCPLPFLKGCWRYIISVGCPGLVCNNFLGKDRCMEPKKLGYGYTFPIGKDGWVEPSYVSFFAELFFFVCSLFCRGNIMSVDISWLKIYAQNPPQNRRRRSAMRVWSVSFPTSVRPGGGWSAAN